MWARVSRQLRQLRQQLVILLRLPCLSTLSIDFVQNITQYRNVLKFPSDEDLNGAAVALLRLQDTYQLDTSSVARGKLNGIQYR